MEFLFLTLFILCGIVIFSFIMVSNDRIAKKQRIKKMLEILSTIFFGLMAINWFVILACAVFDKAIKPLVSWIGFILT